MGSLADYSLEAILFRTGTGVVQGARYRQSGHQVALEQLSADLAATPGFVDELAAAGARAAELRHPAVLPVYDLIAEHNQLWVVTGRADGRILRAICPAGSALQPQAALAVIDDTLAALDAAHRLGIVHGDVQPDQILVDSDGIAVLRGFAVNYAVATTPGAPPWRHPALPSPERQRTGRPDAAGDVFSAAAMARELLTGGVRGAPGRQPLSPQVAGVLAHALAEDPAERFGSAADLRAALQSAARRDGVPNARWPGDLGGAVFRPGSAAAVAPEPEPRRGREGRAPSYPRESRAGGRTAWVIALVAVVLLAGGGAAWYATLGPGGSSTSGRDAGAALTMHNDLTLDDTVQRTSTCDSTYTFTAMGTMSGAGDLSYSWQRDNGAVQTGSQAITADQGSFRFTYPVRVSGTQQGTVTFRVLSPKPQCAAAPPGQAAQPCDSVSKSFTYSC